jgi:serine/threonine protein kinase
MPQEVRAVLQDPTRLLNQYILVRVLGKGGMGEVWKAWDRKLTRWVAIKFLLAESEEGVRRFDREAKLAARLSHPNIAPVHEVGEAPSRQPGQPLVHFLAMEFIDGGSLAESKLSMREHLEIFISVAGALEAAHRMNVVHRDIKPQNIMVTHGKWPYVMDFGLAKSVDSDSALSVSGAVLGTPAFMSPEQVEGNPKEVGPAADIYSFGATMYAVFCQAHPFNAKTTLQLLQKVCNEAPPPPRGKNPEIPSRLEALILKAMAKKAQDRFPSMQALGEELRTVLREMESAKPAPAPGPTQTPGGPPIKLILAGAAAVFLFFALGLGVLAYRWISPKDTAQRPLPDSTVRDISWKEGKSNSGKSSDSAGKTPPPDPSQGKDREPFFVPPSDKARPEDRKPDRETLDKGGSAPPVSVAKTVLPTAMDAVRRAGESLAAHYRDVEFATESDYWAALALLRARVPDGDPALKARILRFLERPDWLHLPHPIRVAAVRALALEASGHPGLRARAAEVAQALLDSQGPGGGWNEESPIELVPQAPPASQATAFIISGDEGPRRFSLVVREGQKSAKDGDVETTLFGLWALSAAAACGHEVPSTAWAGALGFVEGRWNRSESAWSGPGTPPRPDPSLTMAALEAICLARRGMGDPEAKEAQIVRDSLVTLAPRLALRDPGEVTDPEPLSYLGRIEQLGGLLGSPGLGPHPWYPLGSRYLLAAQKPDGSWTEGSDPVAATARGILFLLRQTTLFLEESARGGPGVLETRSLGGCSNLFCILDASGRMRQEMDQKERFAVAKDVITELAGRLPEGSWFGLRAFGHRHLPIEPGSEVDSELILPFGPLNRGRVRSHLGALRVRGGSLLTLSLIEAAGDVAIAPADMEVAVLLFIDGWERNPKADPVPATGDLAGSRMNMKVHVVGFNAEDESVETRLQKMAESGNGRYIRARHREEILSEVVRATLGERDYVLSGTKGEEVARGTLGDRRNLPEGRYTLSCGQGPWRQEGTIWINPGLITRILVNQDDLSRKK